MSINFTLVKRGYNPVEVDNYIKTLEQQLNEYREKTTAINNAIINAQLAADNIIKEAHLKTEKILSGAENDALKLKQRMLSQIMSIKKNVEGQKNLVEAFQDDYNQLLKKYLKPIETGEVSPILSKLNDINKLIDELSNPNIEDEKKDSNKFVNTEHLSNPYAKINTGVSNPYAKNKDVVATNPYAKISQSNPYAKIENSEDQGPKTNDALRSTNSEKNISPFENNNSPFENSSFPTERTNINPLKPGIYKTDDLYNNASSDEDVYSRGLSKEEIEELMPPKR